ncbi:Transcriptional activator hacA [Neolecta irregularis DAH-3]|uniref:Transcriptional activator hacA n=1 Tax=Neolecta irregularis (strain DAH-3) TaxID=1198029 RepID=A0A1U7LMZ0_NEOID|nr:Transcriptional activator hacA [Neolecta irregularis DAH-3]|eukprot:OLL23912.1 Transcriptional activator hacA [Neolecta irregularis DAH-3]
MAAPRRPSQSSVAYSDHLGPSLWASPPPSVRSPACRPCNRAQVKAESPRQDQSAAFLVSPQDLDTSAGSHLHNAPRKPRKKARTAEEKAQRQQERILRNRLAAQTSRERKRKYIEDLEGMRDSLRSENSQLVKRVRSLEGENKELMSRLESMAGQIEDLKATVSCYDSPYQRSTGYRPLTPQARSPPPSQPQYLPVASVQHQQPIQWTTSQAYIPDTTTILNMSHPAVMSDQQSLLRPALSDDDSISDNNDQNSHDDSYMDNFLCYEPENIQHSAYLSNLCADGGFEHPGFPWTTPASRFVS